MRRLGFWALGLVICGGVATAQKPTEATSIEQVLNAAKPQLHRCWEKAAADDFHLEGDVVLRLHFGASGKPDSVEVAADGPRDTVLTDCLIGLAKGWTFTGFSEADAIELPLSFLAPAAQYTVRVDDAPRRRPRSDKVEWQTLVGVLQTGSRAVQLHLLTLPGASVVPLHRYAGTEIGYLLDGVGRVNGIAGGAGEELRKGDAFFISKGVVSGFQSKAGKNEPTRLLLLRVVLDLDATTDLTAAERARSDTSAAQPLVVRASDTKELAMGGGQGGVKIVFDEDTTHDPSAYVGILKAGPQRVVPEHVHAVEDEILFLLSGRGEMTVAGESVPVEAGMGVFVPKNTKHSFRVTSAESVTAVQFYSPSGPEQRFKTVKP